METAIIFSRIFGLYLVIICFFMLINPKSFHKLFASFIENPVLINFSGFITLIFGITIISVLTHWHNHLAILIYALGWIMIISGVIRLVYPETIIHWTKAMAKPSTYFTASVIGILIGSYFLYHGFFV